MIANMRRLHPRGAVGSGICVDVEGVTIGPDCVLVRRTSHGYNSIDREDASALQKCLFDAMSDQDWLFRQCKRIADALNQGEVALAQIFGLHIPIDELDVRRLAHVALAKANFNPDEPRVPKGDPHGGEWTNDGNYHSDGASAALTEVAYPGVYHNWVVNDIAQRWRAKGSKVLTSVEVKTGNDPQYTPGQQVVYPMAQVGDHVYSPNAKIADLGFSPSQWLPPMIFITFYKKDPQSPYRFIVHSYPIVP